jgi:hypothetical protein
MGTLHEDLRIFMVTSCWILLRMRNISDGIWRKNQNILCSITFSPRKSCRLWDNVEKFGTYRQDTDGNIIRRMLCLSLITKDTTHTHVHTHTNTHTHTQHIHTYTRIHTYAHTYPHKHTQNIHTHLHTYTHTYDHTRIHTLTHTHTHIHTHTR